MADEKNDPPVLSADVKDKYKMKFGFAAGEYNFRGQKVDLRYISLDALDKLVAQKFDVVVPIPPPAKQPDLKKS